MEERAYIWFSFRAFVTRLKFCLIMTMVAVIEWHGVMLLHLGALSPLNTGPLVCWRKRDHCAWLFPALPSVVFFWELSWWPCCEHLHHRNRQMLQIRYLCVPSPQHILLAWKPNIKYLLAHHCTGLKRLTFNLWFYRYRRYGFQWVVRMKSKNSNLKCHNLPVSIPAETIQSQWGILVLRILFTRIYAFSGTTWHWANAVEFSESLRQRESSGCQRLYIMTVW